MANKVLSRSLSLCGIDQIYISTGDLEGDRERNRPVCGAPCLSPSKRATWTKMTQWRLARISLNRMRPVTDGTWSLFMSANHRIPGIWCWHFMWKISSCVTSVMTSVHVTDSTNDWYRRILVVIYRWFFHTRCREAIKGEAYVIDTTFLPRYTKLFTDLTVLLPTAILAGFDLLWAHENRRATDRYAAIWWLVHCLLVGALLHLVQWGGDWAGGDWAGCGPAQSPLRCTKHNSPPINGQCTNFILFDVALQLTLTSKGLMSSAYTRSVTLVRRSNSDPRISWHMSHDAISGNREKCRWKKCILASHLLFFGCTVTDDVLLVHVARAGLRWSTCRTPLLRNAYHNATESNAVLMSNYAKFSGRSNSVRELHQWLHAAQQNVDKNFTWNI